MSSADRAALTYRCEQTRSVCLGVLEAATNTFFLLVLNRWFHAGATSKALVTAGPSLGMLCGPLIVALIATARWPAARAAGWLSLCGAAVMCVAATAARVEIFVLGAVLMNVAQAGQLPIRMQVYHDNFPAERRGAIYAKCVMVRIVAAAAFSALGGWLLARDLGWFRALLLAGAAGLVVMWLAWRRTPTEPLTEGKSAHPLRALRHLRSKPLFTISLISWALMGFGNLTMLPLRVEYLANPRYGISLPADQIALLTGVLPNVARLALIPIWGRIFDRANVFTMRALIHVVVVLAIFTFFTSDTPLGIALGALCFGISVAGADVLWPLWVTKIAPPEDVAEYAAVHAMFTGARGVLAPLIAFHALEHLPIGALVWVSIGLVAVASLLLWPEARAAKQRAPK